MSSKMFKRILFTILGVFFGMVVLGHIVGPPPNPMQHAAVASVPAAQPDLAKQHRLRAAAEMLQRLHTLRQRLIEKCDKFGSPPGCETIRNQETWKGIAVRILLSAEDEVTFMKMVELVQEYEREIGRIEFEAWAKEGQRNR